MLRLFAKKAPGIRVILIFMALCFAIPYLWLIVSLKQEAEKEALSVMGETSLQIARGIATTEHFLHEVIADMLERMIRNVAVQTLAPEACSDYFARNINITRICREILLVNSSGDVLAAGTAGAPDNVSNLLPSGDLPTRVSILPGYSNPPYTGTVLPYVRGFRPAVDHRETGPPEYALIILVDAEFYASIIHDVNLPDRWTFSLIDSRGTLLYCSPSPFLSVQREKGKPLDASLMRRIQEGRDQDTFQSPTPIGLRRIFGYVKLRTQTEIAPHMTILASYSEKEALQKISAVAGRSIIMTLAIAAVSTFLAFYFGIRYLSLPIEKFLSATTRFASGDLEARSNINYRLGEIGMLARSFDEMANVLEEKNNRQRETDEKLALYTSNLEELVQHRTLALEESQKRTRLILDSTSEGILELDLKYRITFANKAALDLLEKNENELLWKNFFEAVEYVNPEGKFSFDFNCPIRQALEKTETSQVVDIGFRKKGGDVFPVSLYLSPVLRDGLQTGFVLAFLDMTKAIETHEMMNAIYTTTSNGYLIITEGGEILDCNPAMIHLFRARDKQEIFGNFLKFSPQYQPDGQLSADKYDDVRALAMQRHNYTFEWLHTDSQNVPIPCKVTLARIQLNQLALIVASLHDLRDQQKAQEALAQQGEQLQHILDSTPIALFIMAQGKIKTLNRNGRELLGLEPGDKVMRILAERKDVRILNETLLEKESINKYPLKLRDREGKIYDTLVSLKSFVFEGEKALLAWVDDVTELIEARRTAEAAARAQSDFLARMSHEIRTPMNAILGMSHLCLLTPLSEKQHNYLTKIHSAATTLLDIINDILDFSKIEMGKMELERIPFRLSKIFKDLWALIAFRTEEKNIPFIAKIDENVPDYLMGDSLRLKQILLNLCNNALKFTSEGEIVLSVAADDSADREDRDRMAHLTFTVKDTGIGIRPEQISRLFDPFAQADSSITRKYGGSGLGLPISKYLVESMGGEIEIESVFGEGTVARFSLCVEIDSDDRENAPVIDFADCRSLVIDEDQEVLRSLGETLSSMKMRVETSSSKEHVADLLRSAINEKAPYRFIFLDHETFKDRPHLFHSGNYSEEVLPRIIMTSDNIGELSDGKKIPEVSGIISKTAGRSDIHDLLSTILHWEHQKADCEKSGECPLSGEILLVEDNLINQEVAVGLLKTRGLRPDIAGNGKEALKAVQNKKYDLILMDIQMPVMDGLEAARRIRLLPGCGSGELPIVAMTAHAMKGDHEKSLTAGMNDHITKPIDPPQLFQALSKWLWAGLAAMPSGASFEKKPNTEEILLPEIPDLLLEQGLIHVGRNRELYSSLLRRFPDQYAQEHEKIKNCLDSGNLEEAQRLAHTLKSVSGTLGMMELSLNSEYLESDILGGRDCTENLQNFAERLRYMVSSLRAFFEANYPPDETGLSARYTEAFPEGADKGEIIRTIEKLPELMRENLTEAWEGVNRLEPIFSKNGCAGEFTALAEAIHACDLEEAIMRKTALLSCLTVEIDSGNGGHSDE